ncbi:MAG: ORF6N domain-containing protein [Pirellulaceae bacterium]|jgi:hypothetical protein|nr:ORF6N domain-containing protein [Pirellulaceae bacterium]
MGKSKTNLPLAPQLIEQVIHEIRGQRVLFDFDLARLYGVPTKALNQAVKRNADRFPADFAFQLSTDEVDSLRSQFVTANPTSAMRRTRPWAFTEHGVAMLSSVLNSKQAVQVNIAIMRAFVQMRRISSTPGELVSQLLELAKTVQLHDTQIRQIVDVLTQIMEPPPAPPKRRIGFHQTESKLTASPNGRAAPGVRP